MEKIVNKWRLKFLTILICTMTVGVAIAVDNIKFDEKPEVLSVLEQKMLKKISVDFRETPIEDVIMIIAKQVDMDIVKSPDVTGQVTASLTDVPLREALNHLLAVHGYAYVASRNMIRIVPAGEVAETTENLVNRIYRITYADVREVQTALQRFISKRGSLSFNPGTSNIIVTDTESKIKAIDTFIEEVDRVTPQILVEAKIYDITSTNALDIGIDWFAGRNTTFDPTTGLATGGATDPFIRGEFDSSFTNTSSTDGLLRFGILNESLDIDATLTARQEDICATLLANPRILVLDNEVANIKIIREVPFQELTQTTGGGNIGTTEFKEIGVELDVIPHLARDGMIRLKLKPKFSTQVGSVSIIIPNQSQTITSPQPIVDSREATTTTLIKDGQTVVIGGLRKKETQQEVSKIPLLGDLPLLGGLFRFESEEIVNSELVVFITPRIIIHPALTEREAANLLETEVAGPECGPSKLGGCDY